LTRQQRARCRQAGIYTAVTVQAGAGAKHREDTVAVPCGEREAVKAEEIYESSRAEQPFRSLKAT